MALMCQWVACHDDAKAHQILLDLDRCGSRRPPLRGEGGFDQAPGCWIRPRDEAQSGVGSEILWEEMLRAQASGIIGYRAAVHHNGWPESRTEQRLHLPSLTVPGNTQSDRRGVPADFAWE